MTIPEHTEPFPGSAPSAGRPLLDSPGLEYLKTLRARWRWVGPVVFLVALAGIYLAFATSPDWNFRPVDDLAPPTDRPKVADAVPSDAVVAQVFGVSLLRTWDGLPDDYIFTTPTPFGRDVRQNALDGAWLVKWTSPDAATDVWVEAVASRGDESKPYYVHRCAPSETDALARGVVVAGYTQHDSAVVSYCLQAISRRVELYVAVTTADPTLLADAATRARDLLAQTEAALPTPNGPAVQSIATPNAASQINRGLLLGVVFLPLLWSVPSLLLDRATWQRLGSIFRSRWRHLPGLDVDSRVRSGLWAAMATAAVQAAVSVWALRLTRAWPTEFVALAVIAAVMLVSAPPRIAYLRRTPSSRLFSGWRRLMAGIGLVLGVGVVAFALTAGFFAVAVNTFGLPGLPSYIEQRLTFVTLLATVPIALVATLPLMLLRRLAMRAMRTQPIDRPTVLLLRSFADDARRLRAHASYRRSIVDRLGLRRFERFEEIVAVSLNTRGQVLAVGQPGQRLPPPLGAVRRQFTDEEWEARVVELMASSAAIAVTVGRSHYLAVEIERIRQHGHLAKTIFLFPPTKRSEHTKRLAVLGYLLGIPWPQLDVARTGSWVLAVTLPDPGRAPVVIRARAQEDLGYDIALELCAAAIASDQWASYSRLGVVGNGQLGPAPAIYPPGKTPRFVPIARRVWVLNLVVWLCCAPAGRFLFPGGDQAAHAGIGHGANAVAVDPSSGTIYGIVDYQFLVRVSFNPGTVAPVETVPGASELVADAGVVYLAEIVNGEVEAYDTTTSRVLWTLTGLPGVRGLTLRGSTLTFAVPATHRLMMVNTATGQSLASADIDGTPWATARSASSLWVSVIDRDEVLTLDPATLAVLDRTPTGSHPDQVVALGDTAWVNSVSAHTLAPLSPPDSPVIYLRNQDPRIASNGTHVAVEGIEQITTFDSAQLLLHKDAPSTFATGLAVLPSGDVVESYGSDFQLVTFP